MRTFRNVLALIHSPYSVNCAPKQHIYFRQSKINCKIQNVIFLRQNVAEQKNEIPYSIWKISFLNVFFHKTMTIGLSTRGWFFNTYQYILVFARSTQQQQHGATKSDCKFFIAAVFFLLFTVAVAVLAVWRGQVKTSCVREVYV